MDPKARGPHRITGAQVAFVVLLLVALGASLLAGPLVRDQRGQATGGTAPGATTLTAGGTETAAEPGLLERALPTVTEVSFFGLIGFALGYATRKLVKVLLLAIAVIFLAIQGMSWAGWIAVDWSRVPASLEGLLAGVREGDPLSSFLVHRIPAGAALLTGVLVGFRRG